MVKDAVLEIFGQAWPMIVIFTIILSSMRITYLILNKEKFVLYKELTTLLFLIYISSLFYILTFQDDNYGLSNFTPFKEIFRYEVFSRPFIKNVFGNIMLYMPFGLFVTAYLNKRKIVPTFILTVITSCSVEIIQSMIGRVFDIDDIILNVVGGILGAIIFIWIDKVRSKLPRILNRDWFINLIAIIFLMIGILYFTDLWKYIYEMVK